MIPVTEEQWRKRYLDEKENADEKARTVLVTLRIDNARERDYFLAGGVLPYVAHQFSTMPRQRGRHDERA